MRLGLTGRILIGGVVVAVIFAVQFVLVVQSFRGIREDTRNQQRAQQAVVAAVQLEKLVLDLETSVRGYAIAADKQFLEPYEKARRSLPAESARLMALAPGPWSAELDRLWRAYLADYSLPLVRLAEQAPAAARARIASGVGKRRVDRMRGLLEPFVQRENEIATRAAQRVEKAENSGVVLGAVGSGLRLLVLAAITAYLLRWIVAPIRRLAAATQRVAAGEFEVAVPEGGPGEVGQLATSFNEMSRALTRHQTNLAEQNVDLERLANVLTAVLDSTIDGILLSDAEGNMQLANRPLVRLTREMGMSYDGTIVDRLLSVAHRVRDEEGYRRTMEGLRTNPDDSTFDEFEDSVTGRVYQGFTSPVLDDRGGFLGRLWTLRDVTQQRELDRLKDDFVATVSHELRTPLTSMMGFLEMIREGEAGELNDEQKRFLAIVYRSSERLQRLVGDLLFVARLDANGLQLRFGEAQLDDIVRDAVESSGALARSREVSLVAELGEVPPVSGDRERLLQLVSNLVSNALKFTPAGGSVIARTFVDADQAVVEIADTGIGIPLGEQSRLFQRFFRSSTATEQAIPGTGLGLVISRAIAEAHGGTITVTSAPGEGTTFRVEIPLEPEEVAA
ncbi:MAG: multi-sensor signal transduction histidine kinase [Actinomycetia bacterium]|nr:multi-sensor signal transduction histidine kinase [Actinomycetes bacterium]